MSWFACEGDNDHDDDEKSAFSPTSQSTYAFLLDQDVPFPRRGVLSVAQMTLNVMVVK